MKLGFSVEDLLPTARGGGALKMRLTALAEDEWLQPAPNLAARAAAFDAHPESVQDLPQAETPARELAALVGVSGGIEATARAQWEDVCLLTRDGDGDDEPYRLVGAAVAFPTDWQPADKLGLPLTALHRPIHGYAEQLASGVDHFMAALKPGATYGRCNWFIAPTDALRWVGDPPERAFAHVTAINAGERLFIRCERQTLRKLPASGAIAFTIGVYVNPLGSLSRGNITRLAEAV
ncbi:MAG: DUF3445 domain-containing protein, partial [Croceibacterium sp.]